MGDLKKMNDNSHKINNGPRSGLKYEQFSASLPTSFTNLTAHFNLDCKVLIVVFDFGYFISLSDNLNSGSLRLYNRLYGEHHPNITISSIA